MKFDAVSHTLTLERKNCVLCHNTSAGPGHEYGYSTCTVCKGTGNGPRGKRRGCRNCYGRGKAIDYSIIVECKRCHGAYENFDVENFCDRVPGEAVAALPVEIVYVERGHSTVENLLGLGLGSCTDYGTAFETRDRDKLMADVQRFQLSDVQALNIVKGYQDRDREAMTLPMVDAIKVVVNRGGYSVIGA